MYIIFSNKNKQYTINKNKFVKIDLIKSNIGDKIIIKDILYFKDEEKNIAGNPFIENTELTFEVIKHIKDKKTMILKFKRRKNYLKKTGHRQKYTMLKLILINNKEV
ncbi:MAG TPA: 50S ribosomal protein L21 [Candidatus Azoamicus sp. MARI]